MELSEHESAILSHARERLQEARARFSQEEPPSVSETGQPLSRMERAYRMAEPARRAAAAADAQEAQQLRQQEVGGHSNTTSNSSTSLPPRNTGPLTRLERHRRAHQHSDPDTPGTPAASSSPPITNNDASQQQQQQQQPQILPNTTTGTTTTTNANRRVTRSTKRKAEEEVAATNNGTTTATDANTKKAKKNPLSPLPNCCICLCDIEPNDISSIDGCNHRFCFECIETWANRENTCPLCKIRFTKIGRLQNSNRRGIKKSKKVVNRDQRSDLVNPLQALFASMEASAMANNARARAMAASGNNNEDDDGNATHGRAIELPPALAALVFSDMGPAGGVELTMSGDNSTIRYRRSTTTTTTSTSTTTTTTTTSASGAAGASPHERSSFDQTFDRLAQQIARNLPPVQGQTADNPLNIDDDSSSDGGGGTNGGNDNNDGDEEEVVNIVAIN
uniref:RING-type domain-containing protein n=1 Tax=Asterionellopsis glacialis TaxID=33640 RepID=A0A7S0KY80_9STRA|mmetsp:Transcript_896/g.1270  ORF Transcript_896/g.1270 Transcript_896/m.1270 type:complete len:450 (+) Transcript_896:2-1351(+)